MTEKVRQDDLDLTVHIDAVKFSASAFLKEVFKRCPQFHCDYDYRLDGTPEDKMYDRACGYINTKTGTKIGVAYNPLHDYMPPCIFNVSPPGTGLWRPELDEVLENVPEYRFSKVEFANVFRAGSIVNVDFARKHLIVGKSQRSDDPRFPGTLYFGSRTCPVFTRGYTDPQGNFKLEPEYHRQWLTGHGITTTTDFPKLAQVTLWRHIAFYRFDPLKLAAALARTKFPVESTLRKVIARQHDIYKVLDFLRHNVGLKNTLRVLTPLATNRRVERAQHIWAEKWTSGYSVGKAG